MYLACFGDADERRGQRLHRSEQCAGDKQFAVDALDHLLRISGSPTIDDDTRAARDGKIDFVERLIRRDVGRQIGEPDGDTAGKSLSDFLCGTGL